MRTSGRLALFVLFGILAIGRTSPARDAAALSRAATLAQLGIQDAEARLKAYFPFRSFDPPGSPRPYKFWGSDTTELVEPAPGSTLESAVNPSFAVEADGDPSNSDPTPRTLVIEGAARGLTGTQGPGTYAANGDQWALKISDLSGRIYVNDGIDGGPTGSVSQNLKRILNLLGGTLGVPQLGDTLLAARPVGGYANLEDLLPVLGSESAYGSVRDFLTVRAWVDRNVVNPVPLSVSTAFNYPVSYYRGSPSLYRFTSSVDTSGVEIAAPGGLNTIPNVGTPKPNENSAVCLYGLDQLNPQWIEIVGRAPVNVNAAPREILVALLTDLKGFFVSDRRRNNPRWKGDLYLPFKIQNTFSPGGTEGDEVGFLMETCPIVGPGGTAVSGISAFTIADEIIACRSRKASANCNYAVVPWSGPFQNWHQFSLFVDNLVTIGVINDPRPLHFRYEEETSDPVGFGNLVADPYAQANAAKAVADVLKANFNPNCHLNEINPDENLYLRVDKTDLVVNSTEFCFAPTGCFEVQSLGRVVRPKDGSTDALAATDNALVAQSKATAVLQLYDLYRETSQRQFYAGSCAPRTGAFDTNNNASVEIGPEPDNGVFPGNFGAPGSPDNEWDGYLTLPTIGGVWHGSPVKAKNTLATTLGLSPAVQFNSIMHCHYTLDSDACHHIVDRQEIAGRTLPGETVTNLPDLVGGVPLAYPGPYDPTKGPGHRIARSFRRALGVPDPPLPSSAPSDLRLDGLQTERHCAPAYYVHKGASHLWDFSTENARGMVSLWIKPSFFPDQTGKIRKIWDMSRYHSPCGQNVFVSPFEVLFMPVHYSVAIAESNGPRYWSENVGQFQPSSMYFGSRQWHTDDLFTSGSASSFGKITSSLNHLDHVLENPACTSKPSPMKDHHWMNVAFSWALNGSIDASATRSRLYINGSPSYVPFSYTTMTGGWGEEYDKMNAFNQHSGGGEFNHMRIGGVSRICNAAMTGVSVPGGYRGNYSPDFTIDELFVWKTEADADPLLLWQRGRYLNPVDEAGGEGTFRSQAISLPPATAGAPVKVLGAAWTWYGEAADPTTAARTLYDYNNPLAVGGTDVQPQVQLTVHDGAVTYGPLANDGFSPVQALDGSTPVIADPTQLTYGVRFRLANANLGTILLASPVFDDVTLYWSDGRASTRIDTESPIAIAGPAALADGTGGTLFTATFTASGGGPVTWAVSGTLPPGMTLDPATGVYSGTPTTAGTYTFTVTAISGSNFSSTEYTQTIQPGAGGATSGGGGKKGGCGLTGIEALLLWLFRRAWLRRSLLRARP